MKRIRLVLLATVVVVAVMVATVVPAMAAQNNQVNNQLVADNLLAKCSDGTYRLSCPEGSTPSGNTSHGQKLVPYQSPQQSTQKPAQYQTQDQLQYSKPGTQHQISNPNTGSQQTKQNQTLENNNQSNNNIAHPGAYRIGKEISNFLGIINHLTERTRPLSLLDAAVISTCAAYERVRFFPEAEGLKEACGHAIEPRINEQCTQLFPQRFEREVCVRGFKRVLGV